MKIYKKDIVNELKLNKIWNKTGVVFGVPVATVMWKDDPWYIIREGDTFEDVTATVEAEHEYFHTKYQKYTYEPVAQFHTQLELASYIYNKIK